MQLPNPIPRLRAIETMALSLILSLGWLGCGEARQQATPPDRAVFEAGRLQYPGTTWRAVERPSEWLWSEQALAEAREYFDQLESASVMVVHRGVLIASWGDIATRYNSQSMRKALVGAMIGQEAAAGRIRLDATLDEVGLDDSSHPLTPREKQARVVDLMQSTSGVYISALYEAGGWKRNKPERGAHAPGEAWYYNNWGFNALGTLFERASDATIDQAFDVRIARPIGMEDYRPKDVHYLTRDSLTEKFGKNDSEHRAYVFMISTRDLARFGLLYLAQGRWQSDQVVPAEWVHRSTHDHVATLDFLGGDRFGYLWWVSPADSTFGQAIGHASYKTTGGRGHKMVVVPDLDLVIVHRLATGGVSLPSQLKRRFLGAPAVDDSAFTELARRIVAAHPDRR